MSSISPLWQNCATASQSLQLSCLSFTNIVKNSFTDWFTCSICPSVCRWYAVEGFPYFSTDFPSFLGNGQCFDSINLITGSLAHITPAPFENLNLATSRKGELDSTLLGEHGEYILCPFLFFQHLRKQCMVLLHIVNLQCIDSHGRARLLEHQWTQAILPGIWNAISGPVMLGICALRHRDCGSMHGLCQAWWPCVSSMHNAVAV